MKTTLVNFIGYGDWGCRLAAKVQDEGFTIHNLVTNKKEVSINCNNILTREDLDKLDWSLPTFIATGPKYHHEILKQSKEKVFVEKPYLLYGQVENELPNKPYVNYHWYNSLKLKTIKVFLGRDWENLKIDFFTTTKVDRGFSTLEDFLPHVISMVKFLNPGDFEKTSIKKISEDIYQIDFSFESKKMLFTVGISDQRVAKFQTETILIETKSPKTFINNGVEYSVNRDQLAESIHRYYNYYLNGSCERIFYDNQISDMSLNLLKNEIRS